ncbi:MAG TPA: RDD family protein [Alphaproteobacteria bacterium]|nr:RDD family protein [Alphaproteobacteria bacterium]
MATDKLTIDTPEQVHLEFVLAGIGSRFMAVFLDTLIQVLIYVALLIVLLIAKGTGIFSTQWSIWARVVFIFFNFFIYWGYFAGFEIFWRGQTPGKRWAGIRVIKDSGRPVNPFEAIGRNLVRVVDFMPGFYGVGILTMLLNAKNRRLGDFVAGTLVVHDSRTKDADLFFNTPAKTEFAFPQAAKLTLAEADLIEAFLGRRLDIPTEVRQNSARQIANMINAKLGIGPDARPADDENFLELVVKEFRNRARYR